MATVKNRPSKACSHSPRQTCDTCSWWVTWRYGGRGGKKQSTTWPTKDLADTANALAKSRQHRISDAEVYTVVYGPDHDTTATTPTIPTVDEWAKTWIADRRGTGDIQEDTIDHQESVIHRRVLPRLGKLRLDQITPEVVTDWVKWLRTQPRDRGAPGPISTATVRKAHTIFHGMLGAAVPKYLDSNPAAVRTGSSRRKSGLPKVERYEEAVFLTRDEIRILVAACPPQIRDMAVVSLLTGLRLGELLVLRVQDVHLADHRNVIQVRQALKHTGKVGPPKTPRSRRDVTLSKQVVEILRELVRDKPRNAFVFVDPKTGKRWQRWDLRRRYWLPALAEAQRCAEHPPPLPPKPVRGPRRKWRLDEVSTCGCKTRLQRSLRWHDLRHTHVSLCVADGWKIADVSRRVGHDSIATTMDTYGHLWPDDGDRVDGLDQYLM